MHSVFLSLYLQKKERMESLKQRRTIRKYQQKDISSDLLNDLLKPLVVLLRLETCRFIA